MGSMHALEFGTFETVKMSNGIDKHLTGDRAGPVKCLSNCSNCWGDFFENRVINTRLPNFTTMRLKAIKCHFLNQNLQLLALISVSDDNKHVQRHRWRLERDTLCSLIWHNGLCAVINTNTYFRIVFGCFRSLELSHVLRMRAKHIGINKRPDTLDTHFQMAPSTR